MSKVVIFSFFLFLEAVRSSKLIEIPCCHFIGFFFLLGLH